ncbi:hypothetical protein ACT3R7_12120 [Halomonas sp. AOP43-A1-21]
MIRVISHENAQHFGLSFDQALAKGIPEEVIYTALHAELGRDIDTAAGNARAMFVSPGSYIDQEYLLVKHEATAWLDSGSDESSIPASVRDHMNMTELDAKTSAQIIVATAEDWEQALRQIRTLRLNGKSAVIKAETFEGKNQAAYAAIAQLEELAKQAA